MVSYKTYKWRKCEPLHGGDKSTPTYELVHYYDGKHCIVLAFFEVNDGDCDMRTVGTRYHDIDIEDVQKVHKITKAFMHLLIAFHEAIDD